MANPEHLQVVRQGADAIRVWRAANAATRLDVRDAELSGVDLRDANLAGTDLNGTDLSGADLTRSDLSGADLGSAVLDHAKLGEAKLRGAKMRQASLPHAELPAAELYEANLVQANLIEANLRDADLRGANLTRAKLHGAFLTRAKLDGADLRSATLAGADLVSATLVEANLCDSSLTGAQLDYADISSADLTGASVIQAVLVNTILRAADFTGALAGQTIWANVDLSVAVGLAQVVHYAPSTIGMNTLTASQGKINEEFLRGCGLTEWEVFAVRLKSPEITSDEAQQLLYAISALRTAAPIQINPLFLSYSHADSDFVDLLDTRLKAKGIRFWRDIHDMKAGRVDKQIMRAISLNRTVVIILSASSIDSDWVEWEVATARELEKKSGRDALCPIAIDTAWKTARWPGPLRQQIEHYHVLDFSRWAEAPFFERQFEKLIDGLDLFYGNRNSSVRPDSNPC